MVVLVLILSKCRRLILAERRRHICVGSANDYYVKRASDNSESKFLVLYTFFFFFSITVVSKLGSPSNRAMSSRARYYLEQFRIVAVLGVPLFTFYYFGLAYTDQAAIDDLHRQISYNTNRNTTLDEMEDRTDQVIARGKQMDLARILRAERKEMRKQTKE